MNEQLLSLELSPAAMKQYINARQVFTAFEQALIPGSRLAANLEGLREALILQEKLNVVYQVGNVDLKTMGLLCQQDMKEAVVVGDGALYAYAAAAGIRLERDTLKSTAKMIHNYPTQPYEAIVIGIDGRMARMRAMQPSDYAKTDNLMADVVQLMIDDYRLYPPDDEDE
ncbi:hypothetical protein ACFQPC_00280 [Herminiimonas glaciei]|uniref:Uncharacterized protein n=1 Tax=Herminiimonas glaciei TaxID=523788 RepID=A0ABW2I679_9BURK